MTRPLDGPRAKITRSVENIKNLNDEVIRYFDTEPKPYRIVGQHENDAREYVFRAFSQPVPLRFRVLAGEVIHHVRSSLDHLTHALIIANGGTPTRKNAFPICTTPQNFEDLVKGGRIAGIKQSSENIIRSVQPFNFSPPEDSPLAILQEYNNIDKHNLLIITSSVAYFDKTLTSVSSPGYTPERCAELGLGDYTHVISKETAMQMHLPQVMAQDGAIILGLQFAHPAPHVTMKADFTPQIAFDQFGNAKLKPVIPALVELNDAVARTIDLFKGEF